jgi:hypothetical protein
MLHPCFAKHNDALGSQHTRIYGRCPTVRVCSTAGLGWLLVACSSGAQGPLVYCVVPGAACCANQACAIGLTCNDDVCVAVKTGTLSGGADSGLADAPADASFNGD